MSHDGMRRVLSPRNHIPFCSRQNPPSSGAKLDLPKNKTKTKKKQEIIIVTKQKKCGRVEPTDLVSCCHTLIPVGVVYTAV